MRPMRIYSSILSNLSQSSRCPHNSHRWAGNNISAKEGTSLNGVCLSMIPVLLIAHSVSMTIRIRCCLNSASCRRFNSGKYILTSTNRGRRANLIRSLSWLAIKKFSCMIRCWKNWPLKTRMNYGAGFIPGNSVFSRCLKSGIPARRCLLQRTHLYHRRLMIWTKLFSWTKRKIFCKLIRG